MAEFLFGRIPDFFWSLGAFVVFVLILLRFGLRPVVKAIDARDAHIRKEIDGATQDRRNAEALRAEMERRLDGIGGEVEAILAKGRREADQLQKAIIDDGHRQVDALRTRALREIEAARHGAVLALQGEVAEISTLVASRILAAQLDASAHQQLVAEAIEEIEARLATEQAV